MQTAPSEYTSAITQTSQRPVFRVLHESGTLQMTWVPWDAATHSMIVHAVQQGPGVVGWLWIYLPLNNWYMGIQDLPNVMDLPLEGGENFISVGGFADTAAYDESLATYHRIQVFPDENGVMTVQIVMLQTDGSVFLFNRNLGDPAIGTGMEPLDSIPANADFAASTSFSVSEHLWATQDLPRIYFINPTAGRIEFATFNAGEPTPPPTPWEYGNGWTLYHLAPYTRTDRYGRDVLYFTGAARNGKGRTLYRTTYDARTTVWTEPEEVFIFDTTNPSNGIYYPMVSNFYNGWYALSYVKQTGDSDAYVSSTFVVVRLADRVDGRWGPEHIIASLTTIEGVANRTTIEPMQYYPVILDPTTRRLQVWTRQGYYATPIHMGWNLAPGGTDVTDVVNTYSADCSLGLTAGQFNLTTGAADDGSTPFDQGDYVHLQTGLVTSAGNQYLTLLSGIIDTATLPLKTYEYEVAGREISALLIDQGQQDEASSWFGANHYGFHPTADAYRDMVLPTHIDEALATDTAVQLADSFRAGDSTYGASAVYTLTLTPFDTCSTAESQRFPIAAPFSPAVDMVVEAFFELVSQIGTVDPSPGVYVGADSHATVYYAFEYAVKTRKLFFVVQRINLAGVPIRTTTLVTTIPPGGSNVYTRIGLKLQRHGNKLLCSYALQNGIHGPVTWNHAAYSYTDTTDPTSYQLTPMSLSVPGYCGILAFSPATGISETMTVKVFLSDFAAFGVRPPLVQEDVVRDGFMVGGFAVDVLGYGYKAGHGATLGLLKMPSAGVGGSQPWSIDGSNANRLRHSGTIGVVRTVEQQTDAVVSIVPVEETEYITFHARMDSAYASSGVTTPFPRIYTGTGLGVTLTGTVGTVASALGASSAIRIWFWWIDESGVLQTLRTMPIPSWITGLKASSGRLKAAHYTFAVQDTLIGVWANDIFLGGLDLKNNDSLSFAAVRQGGMWLTHCSPGSGGYVHVDELWMAVFNTTVAQVVLNTNDRVSAWLEDILAKASIDCALRADGRYRLARSDLARSADCTVQNAILDGTHVRSHIQWLSHVRFVGHAGIYGDAYDTTRAIGQAHRFQSFTDESLKTVEQCREAARRKLHEVNRDQTQFNGSIVFDGRMERLDIVHYDLAPYDAMLIITDFSVQAENGSFLSIQPGTRHVGEVS